MENESINFLDLEEKLKNDKMGTAKDALVQELEQAGREVARAMDKGLAPDEFKKAQALKNGYEVSAVTIGKIWAVMHKTS